LLYGGPLALIGVIARYREGFNGLGRQLMAATKQHVRVGRPGEAGEPRLIQVTGTAIAGVVAIVLGFAAIALAWHHISRTDQLWVQNQEILSGGLGGLGLLIVGVGLLIRDRVARNHEVLIQHLERISALEGRESANGKLDDTPDYAALASTTVSDPGEPVRARRARGAT
jgi:hypothetical protein